MVGKNYNIKDDCRQLLKPTFWYRYSSDGVDILKSSDEVKKHIRIFGSGFYRVYTAFNRCESD